MLSIVSGFYGGRQIAQPATRAVRPMSAKVRAALFDSLGSLDGKIVLDAYAGSGALGFEALSRGAEAVLALESKSRVADIIRQNADELGVGPSYKLITQTVESWLSKAPSNANDIILADPPYAEIDFAVLGKLGTCLAPGGIMVVSHAGKMSSPELQSLTLLRSRRYGDAALSYYQLEQ